MNKSICAVVVTYNRKELLLNCLRALQTQTHPLDHIVVINNASQDGTVEYLRENDWLDSDRFTLITLPNNQGGAGGFCAGIEFAYQKNFDYIWLMDDDGKPVQDCLSTLIPHISDNVYIGPLVLDCDNPDILTFTLRLPKSKTVLSTLSDIAIATEGHIIPDIVMPFNGILFSKKMVDKIGLPKKEYFIWGDDIEYTWRARKNGFRIFTVSNAKFYHPRENTLGTPMFFNLIKFNDTESRLKLYCMCRNNIRNLLDYKNIVIALLFIVKVFWFYSITKPNLRKLRISFSGILDGLWKRFTKHIKYLS